MESSSEHTRRNPIKPRVTTFAPLTNEKHIPIIIVSHGFMAHSRWGFYPHLCHALSYRATVFMVDFSLNGYMSDGSVDSIGFSKNTISREVEELTHLLRTLAAGDNITGNATPSGDIYLLGHSRGAMISLLAAANVPGSVHRICCWSPVADFMRFTHRQSTEWRSVGRMKMSASKDEEWYAELSYLEDVEKNREQFRLATALRSLTLPVRIIYGTQDMVTTPRSIEKAVRDSLRSDIDVCPIPTAGHTFNIIDPMVSTSQELEAAISLTQEFFFG